ncbi:DUF4190 domain-containing protein [Mycobacterium simiae]|uniref:DUF4190 domain-containing protein n=1 Tax=Mycobacterium simiae TaxID=1784 RepID=A0A5B1BP92_MYCSI|nr:DUF4190 domain-containing protein [Mycobacterium simiae]KAA1250558.1 DUF4190 domain-containing protein [Mycobacterium simiae]
MTAPGGSPEEGTHNGPAPARPGDEQPAAQPVPPSDGAPWAAPETSPVADSPPPAYPPPGYPPAFPPPAVAYPPDYATGYPPPIPPTTYSPLEYPTYGTPYPPPMASPSSAYGASSSGYPPPSYPGGYYPPPDYMGGYGPALPGTNTMAIVSLVSSFAGVFCCIGSIVSVVVGTIALNQIKRTREDGFGLAVAGIVIGVATLLMWMIVGIFSIPSH